MIKFLSSWAQGIIVAVIIAALIELILPNGSSKKYVKVVIGMYILFTIVSPIIKKIGGRDADLNKILDVEKYEQQLAKSDNAISQKFEDNNSRNIKDIYVSNLKADISEKLKEKGYKVATSIIEVKDDENYTIGKITLEVIKNDQKTEKNNEIVINTIEIGSTEKMKEEKQLTDDEKSEVETYISQTYGIDKKNINIT
jgi:stage III sporulation protein AF